MAYGLRAFKYLQVSNVEGTVGTAEAAVEILYPETVSGLTHDTVKHEFEQDRNTLAMYAEESIEVSKLASLNVTGDLYDRIAVWMFSNSIRGNVTATQPDATNEPNHYLWTYEPSLSTNANTPDATNGIDTFTFEFGDNVDDYEMEYAFTEEWTIEGVVDEVVTFDWTIGGRQVTSTTKTGALTEVEKAYFPFNKAKFYIDDSYANIGSTQKTGMLRGFSITFNPGFTRLYAADGNGYFTSLSENKKAFELELTYYRDGTNSEAEHAKFISNPTTLSYIRIELLSETEMDSSQSNPEYIYFDFAIQYTEFPEYDDEDGAAVVTASAVSFLDATAGKMATISVGTTLDAYPS